MLKADPGCKSSRIREGVLGNAFLNAPVHLPFVKIFSQIQFLDRVVDALVV